MDYERIEFTGSSSHITPADEFLMSFTKVDDESLSMGILLYLKELGKIEKVPQRLTNYEGGPYSITYYEMEDKEAPGVSPNPTE